MNSRMLRSIGASGLLLWLASTLALGQTTVSIAGLPGTLNWQNTRQTHTGHCGHTRALRRLQFHELRGGLGLSAYRQERYDLRLLLLNGRKKLANPSHV